MRLQSVKPLKWVLVDDGSSDRTGALVAEVARQHPWVVAVHRKDRGSRQAGGGVVEAFYDGYACVAKDDWEFIVKLDGDLSFEPDYFERVLHEFHSDRTIGIAGGTCCKIVSGKVVTEFEGEPIFHVRGPTKIYRRECFDAIGGLLQAVGWDTVDQIKANMLGWKTVTFPHIRLIHHRPTGGAYGSWANWVKNGLANYISGYHPLFMACKCLKRALARPSADGIVEAVGLWCGYMKGYVRSVPQVSDKTMIRYLRNQQWRTLTLRKSLWR
jgi:glycosyltransferase involved in cell wall biosynthesis